jgi:hypothetical protein
MKSFSMVMSDILKFSVGKAGSGDYIAWNYTKNGVFSVKSAYHLKNELGMNQAGRAGPSISTDDHRGWLNLWAADVPGKVKIHVWRLIKNGLAVGDELHRRNIKHWVRCAACYRDESMLHRFWKCPHSMQTWEDVMSLTNL